MTNTFISEFAKCVTAKVVEIMWLEDGSKQTADLIAHSKTIVDGKLYFEYVYTK